MIAHATFYTMVQKRKEILFKISFPSLLLSSILGAKDLLLPCLNLPLGGKKKNYQGLHSGMEASCLELALEGERLCKAGDFKAGAAFFEAAVQVGTEDLKTLSAIYSQLGNAYFYLKEYSKALEYHKHDLTLAR
uniref:Uncharacterized protein n=1 Tax=Monodelphis domestica TaxID=13616 RepID=A0A5F8GHT2_MONDO